MSDRFLNEAIANIAQHGGVTLSEQQVASYAAAANDAGYRQSLNEAGVAREHFENFLDNVGDNTTTQVGTIREILLHKADQTLASLNEVEAKVKSQHGVDAKFPLDEAIALADFNQARDPETTQQILNQQMSVAAAQAKGAGHSI